MEDQANQTIGQADLKIIKKLGRGCQAQVFEVQSTQTKHHFAIKVISTNSLSDKEKKRIEFEVDSNLLLSHHLQSKNFPTMHSYWSNPGSINILFELCQENAETKFKKLSNYTQRYNYLLVMLFDMLAALRQLEQMNIIHRDIKPENILLKNGIFKLADLGLSRLYDASNSSLTNDIGNRLGRSPEFITGNYTFKADIWSLGVHLFYLLENTLPFEVESLLKIKNNPNDIQHVISSTSLRVDLQASGRRSKNILSFLHLILSEMIVIDPQQRSSSFSLLSSFYTLNQENCQQNLTKNLLICYLEHRQSYGQFYLIILLAYHQFYRMDSKIKDEGQINKRKICFRVKNIVYQIVSMLLSQFSNLITVNIQLAQLVDQLMRRWQVQLQDEIVNDVSKLVEIDDALQIYKVSKVRQKFPLLQWIVKLYKILTLKSKGTPTPKLYLWDIPVQLYKMI